MSKSRVLYFDLLNILATAAVVFLHCNGTVHTYAPGKSWAFSLVIEVAFYWAVPIFFMLTGAKTMNYRAKRTTGAFLKARMLRIFMPFLVWSAIIFVLRFGILGPNPSLNFSLGGFYQGLMSNSIEPTSWFFFAMFAVTMSMPILSLIKDNKRAMWYMVICSFGLISVLPYLAGFLGIAWNAGITISVASGYIMYVLLGWLLADKDFNLSKRALYSIYAAGALCLVIRYVYTYVSSTALGSVDRLLFDYMAFTAVLPSVALFLLFKNNEHRFNGLKVHAKAITTISGASFGIYLIHKIVLDNVVVGFFGVPMDSFFLKTLGALGIYLVCLAIVLLLKKIPLINKILP